MWLPEKTLSSVSSGTKKKKEKEEVEAEGKGKNKGYEENSVEYTQIYKQPCTISIQNMVERNIFVTTFEA